jgi:uncharacterized membrane protein
VSRLEVGPAYYRDWFTTRPLSPAGGLAVHIISAVVVLLVLLTLVAGRGGRRDPARRSLGLEAEIFLVIIAACIVSPLAWAHYHVWLLPAVALGIKRTRGLGRTNWIRAALMASFLAAAPAVFAGPHAETSVAGFVLADIMVSNLLFASVICVACLLWLQWNPEWNPETSA